jgi:hypothetical protein
MIIYVFHYSVLLNLGLELSILVLQGAYVFLEVIDFFLG